MLEDASKLFNFGVPKEHQYYGVTADLRTLPSMYLDYPHKTKIISYHILVSDEVNILSREIYAVPDYISDVGGAIFGMMKVLAVLLFPFKKLTLNAMLANKLYMVE